MKISGSWGSPEKVRNPDQSVPWCLCSCISHPLIVPKTFCSLEACPAKTLPYRTFQTCWAWNFPPWWRSSHVLGHPRATGTHFAFAACVLVACQDSSIREGERNTQRWQEYLHTWILSSCPNCRGPLKDAGSPVVLTSQEWNRGERVGAVVGGEWDVWGASAGSSCVCSRTQDRGVEPVQSVWCAFL